MPSKSEGQQPSLVHRRQPADPLSEADDDRPSASTRAARSKQSPPYLIIGAGLLVVMGAFVGQWILNPSAFQTMESRRSQSQGMTPDPAPATMVLVPAGEFMMEARQEYGMADKDERTIHTVYLDAFYIDQYEITTTRYAKFFQETKRSAPKYWSEQVLKQHERKPVVGVDWNEAVAYCSWAGKRLPTEAEWEKAARGTDQRLYPWGNEEPGRERANFDRCCDSSHYGILTDVGSFEGGKSPYGVYDMAGNVWEWVADWSDGGYDATSLERNPTGSSRGEKRVVRGGSWDSAPAYVRSSYRLRLSPTFRLDNIGFRCARDVPK
ncbi:MAG TPA: formylglycine-generating enzyme family protein [Nitrospira sp.]|nr:formylglycine-generating enzyme family protein [Nitrospira sp.]